MKHLLLPTIAAVVLVGCGPSVDIWTAAEEGNIEAVKQHLDSGVDVNTKNKLGRTPMLYAIQEGYWSILTQARLISNEVHLVQIEDLLLGTYVEFKADIHFSFSGVLIEPCVGAGHFANL